MSESMENLSLTLAEARFVLNLVEYNRKTMGPSFFSLSKEKQEGLAERLRSFIEQFTGN